MDESATSFRPEIPDDPYPVYALMRETDPVHFFEDWGVWLVTRHADVVAILRDARFSVERFSLDRANPARVAKEASAPARKLFKTFSQMMLSSDPPSHTRLRGLVSRAFTPRAIEAMRPRIQAIVDELIDDAAGAGAMELIGQFAYPLPVIVIAEMLGVPPNDREQFKRWSDEAIVFLDGASSEEEDIRLLASFDELQSYFRERIAHVRKTTEENLLSALAAAHDGSDRLSEEELISNSFLLLAAGHETTMNLIGNGMLALLSHPEEMSRLRADPSLTPSAVEEMLRFDSPVQWTDRLAMEDVEIDGRMIYAGQNAQLGLASANRDPGAFQDPDRLDVGRVDNRHVAFGHGAHYCLGAALARLEGQIAFETLLRRLGDVRLLDTGICWVPSRAFRRLRHLNIGFSPA